MPKKVEKMKTDKLDLSSMSVTEEQKSKLKKLFPSAFNGDKVDWEKLKATLGEELDLGPDPERYTFNWPGKADCYQIIKQPSFGTLKPFKQESLNWSDTQNIFIEGDNLEVLKLLQKSYYNQVKMIYIDPPYNTGKDFVYPDNYADSLSTYLQYTGQKDSGGKKFSTNQETDGRFHSKWLNMMSPRLFLARNLLKDDGIIFISIDDNEVANLRKLCDEIFGEENFINQFIWKSKKGAQGMQTRHAVVSNHEYIIGYSKNSECFKYLGINRSKEGFSNPDSDSRGLWKRQYLQRLGQGLPQRSVTDPVTGKKYVFETPYSQEKLDTWVKEKRIIFPVNKKGYPARKEFYSEYKNRQQLVTDLGLFPTKTGTEKLYALFNDQKIWTNPKPLALIKEIISYTCDNGIILDFFAGSATTAHAVYEKNMEDGGNRRYILVQLPEPVAPDSEAYKAGFTNIADIGKERIRRVVKKIQAKVPGGTVDLGFRVFKLDKSNFKVWEGHISPGDRDPLETGHSGSEHLKDQGSTDTPAVGVKGLNGHSLKEQGSPDKQVEEQIQMHLEEYLDPHSTTEDLLYEILLKTGYPLTTQVKTLTMANKKVYSIENHAFLVCLEQKITPQLIKEMALLGPARVVCLDKGFGQNDQLKTNAYETFKTHGVTTFNTV